MSKLGALLRGAGQGASAGWNDELSAKLLAAIPQSDGTGISRDYAGGQEEQYKASNRADNADAERGYPKNYMAGQILGAVPAAIAGGAAGAGLSATGKAAAFGLGGGASGALTGAGTSEATGRDLASDAAKGAGIGALGGMAAPEIVMPLARAGARAAAPAVRSSARTAPQAFHATPIENMSGVSRRGLDILEAQKNFPLKKNAGRTYFTDSPEGVSRWNQTIRDATGAEAAPVLRTGAPVQKVPGANESVLIRDQSTPAKDLQAYDPGKKDWVGVDQFDATAKYPAEQYIPPADKLGPAPTGRRAGIANSLERFGAGEQGLLEQSGRKALEQLRAKPPGPPSGPHPALAGANLSGRGLAPSPQIRMDAPQINRAVPPRSDSAMDQLEARPRFAEPPRAHVPSPDSVPFEMPKIPKTPKVPYLGDEAYLNEMEQRLRQTEDTFAKKQTARFSPENQQIKNTKTVRPGKKATKS